MPEEGDQNGENDDETEGDVSVSLELEGDYDDVIAKLQISGDETTDLSVLAGDVTAVLETVDNINGGTRSAIATELPGDMAVSYDAEGVVEMLQVLERYDLVALEGNTWKPGPKLER